MRLRVVRLRPVDFLRVVRFFVVRLRVVLRFVVRLRDVARFFVRRLVGIETHLLSNLLFLFVN